MRVLETYSTTSTSNSFSSAKTNINNLYFKKAAKAKPVKREVHVKKGFWDGVEWKEHASYIPRKSITGKIIIGKMHKRHKNSGMRGMGPRILTQYAKTKELFEEKLRGKA